MLNLIHNYILNLDYIKVKISCFLFIKTCLFVIYFAYKNLFYNSLNEITYFLKSSFLNESVFLFFTKTNLNLMFFF